MFGNSVAKTSLPTRKPNSLVTLKGRFNGNPAVFDIDEDTLSKHTMLIGGTGCGKTTLFFHFVEQIKRKMASDDVMIIFDSKGDFYHKFGHESDLVLGNSREFINKSVRWNIYKEVLADGLEEQSYILNIQEVCKSFFAKRIEKTTNAFFPNAASDLFAKAFHYIEKMAGLKGWNSYGRFMLANYYYNGFGVSPNPERAITLWETLGNEGYADACYKIALVYALGRGREQNADIAAQWAQAALNSNDTAVMKLETVQEKAQALLNTLYNSSNESSSNESNGGCYIATAVYGSYDCPQVWVLRRFRDYRLARTWYGRAFIRTYYAISPTLVKWFGNSSWFVNLWKSRLDEMVKSLKKEGFDDTPYTDLEL